MTPKLVNIKDSTSQGVLRLLQISDTHLYADPNRTLAGINTLETFEKVLELADEHPADMVLATGDLVHDASESGYEALRTRFDQMQLPVFCLPGNHDEPDVLNQTLQKGTVYTDKCTTWGNWLLIFLDSTKPGEPGGNLNEQELSFLEECLATHPQHHVLICLHHHPTPSGSQWLDSMALDNPDAMFSILDRHNGVKGILWGHIHQDFLTQRDGIKMMGSPSTCIQFAPDEADFKLDPLPPGFRWLELTPDGEIKTGVKRLQETPVGLSLSTGGY